MAHDVVTESSIATREPVPEGRRAKPVKWWALAGGAILILETYVLVSWVASGKAHRTRPGPTPVPGWMKFALHAHEVLAIILLIAFAYIFVVRPLRRDHRMSLDGLFFLAFLFIFWQDPLLTYSQNWVTYNSELINFGSWTTNIPGWIAPHSNKFAEPIIWVVPAYATFSFMLVLLANVIMRKAKARWPNLGTVGLISVCFGFSLIAFLVLETFWLRLGIYTYAGSIKWLTLFHGHYYQYPVYEMILGGATFTSWACLRYFRDDKGRTVAERGIDEVRAPTRGKTFIRFLAVSGLLNIMMLGFYNIPFQWFAAHADPWPKDIISRSYLTDGLCGPGTDYACSGPGIPIPRTDSAHLDPRGKLVEPTSPGGGR